MDNSIEKWEQTKEKSKKFGEVFTPDNIVVDMLKLTDGPLGKPEKERIRTGKGYYMGIQQYKAESYIGKKILEPSCGDGQILIRLLRDKLSVIPDVLNNRQKKILLLKALSNIYGVDVQAEVVERAKARMFAMATGKDVETFDVGNKTVKIDRIDLGINYEELDLIADIKAILNNNIICGNTLTGHKYDIKNGKAIDTDKLEDADLNWKLLLTEYTFQDGCLMREYWLHPTTDNEGNTLYVIDEEPTNTYEPVSLGHIKDRKIHIGELTEEQKLIIECEKRAQEALDSGVW